MLRMRDFRCTNPDCSAKCEKLVEDRITQVDCPHCQCASIRIISPVSFKLDCSFPGYADKWARDHEFGAKNPDKAHVHT